MGFNVPAVGLLPACPTTPPVDDLPPVEDVPPLPDVPAVGLVVSSSSPHETVAKPAMSANPRKRETE
jgi:hypothetical protein